MPRANFISVPVSTTMQAIFDDFVKQKDIAKTTALSDMIELYMLATDEELYLNLKKKRLGAGRVKEMILAKDNVYTQEQFSDTLLFIKLGTAETKNGELCDGDDTINYYIEDEKARGYTWFSTDSLHYGMSKRNVSYFKRFLQQGMTVKMLFAHSDWDNDIKYSAEVLDIVSEAEQIKCPEAGAFPSVWLDSALIWIKVRNIKEEQELTASDLAIKSTGRSVKTIISNSQFHFGYVVRR